MPGPGAPGGEGAGTGPPDQTCPSRLLRVPAASRRRRTARAGGDARAPRCRPPLLSRPRARSCRPGVPRAAGRGSRRRRPRRAVPGAAAAPAHPPRPERRREPRRRHRSAWKRELPVSAASFAVVVWSETGIRTVCSLGCSSPSLLFNFSSYNMLCIREHIYT